MKVLLQFAILATLSSLLFGQDSMEDIKDLPVPECKYYSSSVSYIERVQKDEFLKVHFHKDINSDLFATLGIPRKIFSLDIIGIVRVKYFVEGKFGKYENPVSENLFIFMFDNSSGKNLEFVKKLGQKTAILSDENNEKTFAYYSESWSALYISKDKEIMGKIEAGELSLTLSEVGIEVDNHDKQVFYVLTNQPQVNDELKWQKMYDDGKFDDEIRDKLISDSKSVNAVFTRVVRYEQKDMYYEERLSQYLKVEYASDMYQYYVEKYKDDSNIEMKQDGEILYKTTEMSNSYLNARRKQFAGMTKEKMKKERDKMIKNLKKEARKEAREKR